MPNSDSVPNRQNWLFCDPKKLSLSKEDLINHYISKKFAITSQMFDYEGLPDTINRRDLEYLVQGQGYACALRDEDTGKVYVLKATFSGQLNEQFRPFHLLVTNPYLNINQMYEIGKDCVLVPNDSSFEGLMPLAIEYSTQLAETYISLKYASWNSRIVQLVSAQDDATKVSAEKVLDKIVKGDEFGVIATKPLLDSFKAYPYNGNSNNSITNLLELHQYLKANWYIDLGVNSNYNMKRESLSQDEVSVNEDTLLPVMDDMFNCRKKAVEEINKMFGLNIKVKVSSVWLKIKEQANLAVEMQKKEVESDDSQKVSKELSKDNKEKESKDEEGDKE